MSVANRMYWALRNGDLESEFVRWLSEQYPTSFKSLYKQYMQHKENNLSRPN